MSVSDPAAALRAFLDKYKIIRPNEDLTAAYVALDVLSAKRCAPGIGDLVYYSDPSEEDPLQWSVAKIQSQVFLEMIMYQRDFIVLAKAADLPKLEALCV
jgi:hypothetical protein